ncbi:MAG: EpsI family protein [candidate division Zixibacteria bacterium]|nr:EpsI family protein [candidate division Zixibacteria bacterium]
MSWKKADFWIVVGLVVLTGILVNLLRYSEAKPQSRPHLSSIPLQLDDWQGEELHFDKATYGILKADESLLASFRNPKAQVWLFVAYFQSQKYGSQIHSPKHCLPGSGWKIVKKEKVVTNLTTLRGNKLAMNRFVISDGTSQQLMLYWFVTRSGIITNEFSLKMDLVFNSLRRKPTDAAFVRITIPFEQGKEQEAWEVATDFMNHFVPQIDQALGF